MKFLWLLSTSRATTEPVSFRDVVTHRSVETLMAELFANADRTVVFEIRDEDDRDRAIGLMEEMQASANIWIYEPDGTVASSVMWMKCGAAHVAVQAEEIENAVEPARQLSSSAVPINRRLLGRSRSMAKVESDIQMVANRNCTLLIEGETGTGKEVVARETHAGGNRSRGPWVAVNCSAIPEALLEAELFGHTKGAYTGAVQARAGKFEAANHGTIFLDEIGDMPLATQAKLLRVLQEREVERLGGNERIKLDVRVIVATNVDLAERVSQGLFRQDLYYRINVFRIELPPLRDRTEDIVSLANHFVEKFCRSERFAPKVLDNATIERLESHTWPGNVRELENVVEAAVIISGDRATIFPSDLRIGRSSFRQGPDEVTTRPSLPNEGLDYQKTLEEFETNLITQALARSRGNKTAAADLLRMKRTTLSARMRVLETRLPRLVA